MILLADARMIPLADESVHCVITSPPYWGLRDYGLEPSIWGGDLSHKHNFWEKVKPAGNGMIYGEMVDRREGGSLNEMSATRKPHLSGKCECGAWRGCLGLEPTIELYLQHIVEIFREVRRVLRKDGTLWLNLGDSFSGSWGNYHPNSPPGKHGQRPKETARWNRPAYGNQSFLPPTANCNLKSKDLCGIPWRVALALQADGWYLRSDIIWAKSNPMPESVRDRPTRAHEYIFLLAKSERYYFDQDAVREPLSPASVQRLSQPGFDKQRAGPKDYGHGVSPNRSARKALVNLKKRYVANNGTGRNIRSVWTIAAQPYSGSHFATFPEKLVEPCILAGCPPGGVVLDPFAGSGTVGRVAERLNRRWLCMDLAFHNQAQTRTQGVQKVLL